ncbi:hypothetical protein [Deinococcus hopiensis]|uniref:Outer membrane protein beta-barrel domain-containing protein n=1 Tax=Deinococcus hopiensis KR-140 TaxID=695939 RepID=A0A1W1UKH9_9DEIO|nr:hypothetical protein [Deinococcus hopiensis]SMB81635.1 hypothetical protein SAMN00790413_04657 [Deinococcus hopiensis KR-140]
MRGRRPLGLLALLLAVGTARAEGSFGVRYFLPASPALSGLSLDATWRGEALGGQLDARASFAGPEKQSFGLTYTRDKTVVLTQYDASRTLSGRGQTGLLFVQQGFAPSGDTGLRQLGVTAVYTDGGGTGYAFRVVNADLTGSGSFSKRWNWSLGTGTTLSDSGTDEGYGNRTVSTRARAGVTGRFEGAHPASVNLQGSWDHSSTTAGGKPGSPTPSRLGLSGNASVNVTATETVTTSARADSAGNWSSDLGLQSTRPPGWSLSAGANVSGRFGVGSAAAVPAALGWTASVTRAPQPWGGRLTYTGAGQPSPSHALDSEVQYQRERFSVQLGGGVTWRQDAATSAWVTAYRGSAGVTAQGEGLNAQLRLNLTANPSVTGGVTTYRTGGGLSGSVTYTREALSAEFSSALNYAPGSPAPWTGDVGLGVLYKVSERLQVSGSVRYRPDTTNPVQGGVGLRYTF